MPNTTTATWPTLTSGGIARASDVEAKFDYSEFNLWPHSTGTRANNTFDLGDSTTAYWRTAWLFSLNATTTAQGLAIGTTTVNNNSSTALEIAGTRALLIPRLTTAQRGALTPTNGMMIYNSTTNQFQVYENGAWRTMGGAAIGLIAKVVGHTLSEAYVDVVNISTSGRLFGFASIRQTGTDNLGTNAADIVMDAITLGSTTLTTTTRYLDMPFIEATTTTFTITTAANRHLDAYFNTSLVARHRSGGAAHTSSTYVLLERA